MDLKIVANKWCRKMEWVDDFSNLLWNRNTTSLNNYCIYYLFGYLVINFV